MQYDLKAALNAISDVVQNRPLPLREFDQIYMKVGDMVEQAFFIAEKFQNLDVVFIGDGDSIALSVIHLWKCQIFPNAPRRIHVLDFDERIVKAVTRFADKYRYQEHIEAELYNVAEPLPWHILAKADAFYTNPPWGASNGGESVIAFLERGIEAVHDQGQGAVVIGDDPKIPWTQEVLQRTQRVFLSSGFVISELHPEWHMYQLDDAPNLHSCALVVRRIQPRLEAPTSLPLDAERRNNFYGRDQPLRFRYVRERPRLAHGRESDESYKLEPYDGGVSK
jgi:N4-bis(aminopropyl)spermidine synthase